MGWPLDSSSMDLGRILSFDFLNRLGTGKRASMNGLLMANADTDDKISRNNLTQY